MKSAIRMCILLAVAVWLCGCSSEPPKSAVKILDYGLYQGVAIVRPASPDTQAPEVVSINVQSNPNPTTTIPCKADTYFGFPPRPCDFTLQLPSALGV